MTVGELAFFLGIVLWLLGALLAVILLIKGSRNE